MKHTLVEMGATRHPDGQFLCSPKHASGKRPVTEWIADSESVGRRALMKSILSVVPAG